MDNDDDEMEEIGQTEKPSEMMTLLTTLGTILGASKQTPPPINGTATQTNIFTDAELNKLNLALDILKKADKNIVDDLTKLANIAQKNPAQFKFLLGALNNM